MMAMKAHWSGGNHSNHASDSKLTAGTGKLRAQELYQIAEKTAVCNKPRKCNKLQRYPVPVLPIITFLNESSCWKCARQWCTSTTLSKSTQATDSLYLFGPSSRQKVIVNMASSSKNSVVKASHHRLSHSCWHRGEESYIYNENFRIKADNHSSESRFWGLASHPWLLFPPRLEL